MSLQNSVRIFPDIETLSRAAADFVLQIATDSIQQQGVFTIAISGGKTPERLFEYLAAPPFNTAIPWAKTHVYWVDERCVPLNDKENNAHNAIRILFNKVNIPTENVHRMRVDLQPKEAAEDYNRQLNLYFNGKTPKFDLILMGIGDDGHTASLFPGTDVLEDEVSWVKEVYVPQQQMSRVTLMPRLINQAHNILFLVSGKTKAPVLARVLNTANNNLPLPVGLIKPVNGKLFWFVDEAAASELQA